MSDEFDMNAAVESMGNDLFGSDPVEKDPIDNAIDSAVDEIMDKDDDIIKNEVEHKEEAKEPIKEAEKEPEQDKKEDTEVKTSKPLPSSWKKDMQKTWESMSDEARDYVVQREEQMKAGLVKDREDAEIGRFMRDTVKPYEQYMRQNGENPGTVVRNMLNAHYNLRNAPMEQRRQIFDRLAQSYGIKFDSQGQSQEIDPIVKNLTDELNSVKSYIAKSQESTLQATKTKVASEVDAFASDPAHQYFDEVSDEISKFVSLGDDLKTAYDKAVWANPVTRQKEIDRIRQEKAEEAAKETAKKIEEARKSKSVNVRSRDTGKAPTAPKGSMFDALDETYRNIITRNRS